MPDSSGQSRRVATRSNCGRPIPAQLRLIHHGIACLLADQQLQGLALDGHALHVKAGISAAQVIGHGAGHTHGDAGMFVEFFQIHRTAALTDADDTLGHAHVRVGEQPQAQTGRGLLQTGGDVHLAVAQGGFQLLLSGEIAPRQLDVQGLGQPLHQLDIGPRQTLQAPVVLRIRRLQDQPHPQLRVLRQPFALRHRELRLRSDRHGRGPRHQGKAHTADNQQTAKTHDPRLTSLTNTDQPIRLLESLLAGN